jgi:prepilin signal peptidase PulO-like enzyme (type II secretory pathway)
MLIELAMGCGACLMYWYEVEQAAVFAGFAPATLTLHAQFFSHYVLICLTVVATFIDFDEQTIPDAITVPGAVIGLAIAALLPNSRPFVTVVAGAGFGVEHLHLASATAAPNEPSWPPWLDGGTGLCLGILAFFGWWVAVLPYTWTTRRGFAKAVQYFFASVRKRLGMLMPVLAFGGAVGIVATWFFGGAHWESLLSSLTGLTFGGGLIWAVRIVGKNALKQEAMGFGDVTLMAMIGTYTGWQATLMIFFLAPFAAIFISVTQWLLTGRKDIAFGPYLCLAALVVILRWGWLWDNYGAIFALGLYVVFMVVFGVALIWAMLTVMRALRR